MCLHGTPYTCHPPGTVIARILLSFFRASPMYSRPRHRWLLTGSNGSTDSTPGQGGHIPLCAAVHSSLGLASHRSRTLAGLLRPSQHRPEPSEPTKGNNAPRENRVIIVTPCILLRDQWHLSRRSQASGPSETESSAGFARPVAAAVALLDCQLNFPTCFFDVFPRCIFCAQDNKYLGNQGMLKLKASPYGHAIRLTVAGRRARQSGVLLSTCSILYCTWRGSMWACEE